MKKALLTYIIISSFLLLAGCLVNKNNSNDAEYTQAESELVSEIESQTEIVEMKDVVFLNMPVDMAFNGIKIEGVLERMNYENRRCYEYDETKDADTLYAFGVGLVRLQTDVVKPLDYPIQESYETGGEFGKRLDEYQKNELLEIMKDEGIWVLQEDLEENSNACVIVCTMNDLVRVFDGEDGIYGTWDYVISPVTRPDWIDILEELGCSAETEVTREMWYWEHKDEVKEIVGTEQQVTISVEVE